MSEIDINSKKIVSLGEDFSEYELRDVLLLDFDVFVYNYKSETYEGSGFAVWKKGDLYFYNELVHCSCNGPMNDVNTSKNMGISFEALKKLEKGYNAEYINPVLEYFEKPVAGDKK